MKKALIVASVASMIDQFNMPNIHLLQSLGYEVSVACNFVEGNSCSEERIEQLKRRLLELHVSFVHVDISRKLTSVSRNVRAYKALKKMIDEGGYDIIHCHSPIGGLICRLAALSARKRGTVVMYTAHGFHFYRGAPKKNWIAFYPIEKLCSRFTDVLLTINSEDRELAERKMHAGKVVYISGVGIDTAALAERKADRVEKRREIGIPENAFLLASVGEINANKNHGVVIRALAELNDPNVYYVMIGKGELEASHKELIAKLGLSDRVKLLGFREDVPEIYSVSDLCVFPSIREGLGVAAIEGMACGLPLLVADNRGTRDYAKEGEGAFVCAYDDVHGFAEAIRRASASHELLNKMCEHNLEAVKKYDISKINEIMKEVYGGEQ